jgi:hypothetical protein
MRAESAMYDVIVVQAAMIHHPRSPPNLWELVFSERGKQVSAGSGMHSFSPMTVKFALLLESDS